jgi:hypothetical protein
MYADEQKLWEPFVKDYLQEFIRSGIQITWDTIQLGKQMDFLQIHEIMNFAIYYVDINPDCNDANVLELCWKQNEHDINVILASLCKETKAVNALELSKWRYILLNYYSEDVRENVILLEKIDEVYSLFENPEDMYHLIYYHPTHQDLKGLSTKECRQLLVNSFHAFLANEQLRIELEQYHD